MWIVINISGKQEIIRINQYLDINSIKGKALDIILLNRILLIVKGFYVKIGRPIIFGGQVQAIIIQHFFDKKILILRFKRKKHYKKFKGFRAKKTRILIKNLIFNNYGT